MSEPQVFLNGEFIPAGEAKLNIYDAGIVLGATVSDMSRTFRHRLFRLHDHVRRFERSLKYVRFDLGLSTRDFLDLSHRLVEHNARFIDAQDELGLIFFATPGEYPTYAGHAAATARTTPTFCAHTFPMPWELWSEKMRSGQHLVTPSIRHVPPQCYDPNMKYRSRMHFYLAEQEARLAGDNVAALLLDLDGNVTETGGANFLIVEEGTIVSPTLRNILDGISRRTVIELAAELDIPFEERDFQVFSVINAAEAFTATTPVCLMPVTRINGLPIGDGTPGPIFRRLLAAWSEKLGLDIEAQIHDGAKRRLAATAEVPA